MNNINQDEQRMVNEFISMLCDSDNEPNIEEVVKLKDELSACTLEWVEAFQSMNGLDLILVRLDAIEEFNLLRVTWLECMKLALDTPVGREFLLDQEDEICNLIVLFADDEDEDGEHEDEGIAPPNSAMIEAARTVILQILCVLVVEAENGEGYDVVLAAFDYLKMVKGEPVRFSSLVSALFKEYTSVGYKRDVVVFLNTLLNTDGQLEERWELRSEMIHAGLLRALDELRKNADMNYHENANDISPIHMDLENQIEVFDAVLNDDIKACEFQANGSSVINLGDPESLFKILHGRTLESDCFPYFLSLLQHLMVIPSFDILGKTQWETIENAVHQIVAKDSGDFALTVESLKEFISLRDRIEELNAEKEAVIHAKESATTQSVEKFQDAGNTHAEENNVPKPAFLNDIASRGGLGEPKPKPAFLAQIANQGSDNCDSGSAAKPKPAFLAQIAGRGNENSGDAASSRPKPAFLADIANKHNDDGDESSATAKPKPAFLAQIANRGNEPNGDSGSSRPKKPAFLAQIAAKGDENNGSSMTTRPKPAFLADIANGGESAPHPRPKPAFLAEISKGGNENSEETSNTKPKPAFLAQIANRDSADGNAKNTDAKPAFLAQIADKGGKPGGGEDAAKPQLAFLSQIANKGKSGTANEPNPKAALFAQIQNGGVADTQENEQNKENQPRTALLAQLSGQRPMDTEKRKPAFLSQLLGKGGGDNHANVASDKNNAAATTNAEKPGLPFLSQIGRKGSMGAGEADEAPSNPFSAMMAQFSGRMPTSQAEKEENKQGVEAQPGEQHLKPEKPSVTPSVPLRSLFWTKIPDQDIDNTIWKALDDSKIQLDISDLETNFCKQKPKVEKAPTSPIEENKPKTIILVDSKTQQNTGIALAKLRMSNMEIKYALLSMDDKKLNLENLSTLRKISPTSDEVEPVKEFTGDKSMLGKVEKFYLMTLEVPSFIPRLDCFLYSLRFPTRYQEFRSDLETINKACSQIRESQSLKHLLEVIMSLGNYLNGGTPRGGAYGFQIDAILKLATIKSADNQQTLMNYLARWCQQNQPELLLLRNEIDSVEEAARISFSQWKSEFMSFKMECNKLEFQVKAAERIALAGDRFAEVISPFTADAKKMISELETESKTIEQSFKEVVAQFGEDAENAACETFFSIFVEFVANLERADGQNKRRQEMEERARKRKMASEARRKKLEESKASNTQLSSVVDDVIDEIKAKSAADVVSSLHSRSRRSTMGRPGARPSLLASPCNGPIPITPLSSHSKLPSSTFKLRNRGSSIGFKTSSVEVIKHRSRLSAMKETRAEHQPGLASFLSFR